MYRKRFGLTGHPMPKNAAGKTYYDKSTNHTRLGRAFGHLLEERGLGLLTGDAGVGKTVAMRSLCQALPKPEYLVIYQCDTAVSPLDLYRTLALDLGIKPSHRRAQLWSDIKKSLEHMVDERGTSVVVVIDEAQHLSDKFLLDLSGFLNFAFDSRDLLTLWLVGLPALRKTLKLQQYSPLAMRISAQVHFEPTTERDAFAALVAGCLEAVGAHNKLLGDPALELLFRSSRGVFRVTSKLLRAALRLAHERDQSFVDEQIMEQAVEEMFSVGKPLKA